MQEVLRRQDNKAGPKCDNLFPLIDEETCLSGKEVFEAVLCLGGEGTLEERVCVVEKRG